jgi:hypothetical protein
MGASKIFSKFAKLLDRTTVDLPAINTPLAEALAAKAASADLADVATSGAYADLSGTPASVSTVAELTDATTYDFPTLNTPVSDALAAKANSADLGTIATFEGDQPLRTTDSPTFAGLSGTACIFKNGLQGFRTDYLGSRFEVSSTTGVHAMFSIISGKSGWFTDNGATLGMPALPWPEVHATAVAVSNLTASGTVEAASYTRGGVAQQSVGTGDSVEFAGFESTANRNYLKNGAYLRFGGGAEIRGGGTASSNYYFRFGYSAGNDTEINSGGVNTTNLTASGTVTAGDVSATGTVTANTVVLPGGGYLKQYVGGTIGSSGSFVAYGYYIGQNTTSGALLPEAGGGFFTKNLRIVGNLTASGTVTPGSKTVAAANALSGVAEGSLLWITNEAGGPCTAEYNGTAWVRVRDQIAISV